jgi:MFS family permease
VPCAFAQDIGLLLTFRFLSGLAGSSTLAILGDMFIDFLTNPAEHGISTAVFSVATFCGLTEGPILGNLVTTRLGWRWTAWLTLIGGILFGTVVFSLTPETSEVVILHRRPRKTIRRSGALEDTPSRARRTESGVSVFIQNYLTKPTRMFVHEPIVSLLQPCSEIY